MLVCRHPGLFGAVTQLVEKKTSFWDGKASINPNSHNFILELFAPLLFINVLLLKCARYHYEFSLFWSTQFAIRRLTALWNLVPTAFAPSSVPVDGMMVYSYSLQESIDGNVNEALTFSYSFFYFLFSTVF